MAPYFDEPWRIELFGRLRATRAGCSITRFKSRKAGMLLAYLACHLDRSHPRETLIELLWPECEPRAGRQRLNGLLSSLRRQLEPPGVPPGAVILSERDWVRLNPAAVRTDVTEFREAVQAARRLPTSADRMQQLANAVELSAGELLTGFTETWITAEQSQLAAEHRAALRELVPLLEQAGDTLRGIHYLRRALRLDPLDETLQQVLIRLLAASGDPAAAMRQLEEWERRLSQELGLQPPSRTQALAQQIRQQISAGARLPPPAPAATGGDRFDPVPGTPKLEIPARMPRPELARPGTPVAPAYLPLRLTRFFGREAELAQLCTLLGEGVANPPRLLTLTGLGGSGKTRLAIEVAERLQAAWQGEAPPRRGGPWFIPLLDVAEPRLIPDRLLMALRLPREVQTDPLDQAAVFLCRQPSLLVLDNFEHLIPGGTEVLVRLLERVPGLTLLVTSRQRLGIPGEQEMDVAPLPVPVEGLEFGVERPAQAERSGRSVPNSQVASLLRCPSVALFVDRAQGVKPDFQLTVLNAAAVAQLCRGLEGLPLALELAAARAGVLSPAQILTRLEQRFELLTRRQRAADPRHIGLRAALDWSYQLLPPEVRRFFARLSVFRGGWTLEAAEAVCGAGFQGRGPGVSDPSTNPAPDALCPTPTLEYLEQLCECKLVIAETAGASMRYRLLETLREYGAEQLPPDERTARGRRHAHHYLHLAEAAAPRLSGPEQGEWLTLLEAEHDNLRAALSWSLESGEAEFGLRLGGALWRFWQVRGYLAEGRDWLNRLLKLDEAVPGAGTAVRTEVRAQVLDGLGLLATEQGDYQVAQGCLEQGLRIWRGLNSQQAEADSLYHLGDIHFYRCEYAAAQRLYEQSLTMYRVVGDQHGIAMSLGSMGVLSHRQGAVETGWSLHEQSLSILRQLGDDEETAHTLGHLGNFAADQGRHEAARAYFTESLALFEAVGSKDGMGGAFGNLSWLAFREGQLEAACAQAEKQLAIQRELGRPQGVASALNNLGRARRELGELEAAASLHQESLTIWHELNHGWNIARTSAHLAAVYLARGDPGMSESLFAGSLAAHRARGESLEIHECLVGLAKTAVAQHQMSRAARLFGAAEALRAAVGVSLPDPDRAAHDRSIEIARAALGEAAFVALWAEGRAMSSDLATSEALGEGGLTTPAPVQQTTSPTMRRSSGRPARTPAGDLTPRDWERIAPLLPRSEGRRGRPFDDHRRVINGILWKQRTGAPWRDLPARYGSWHTCHERYRLWRKRGIWDRIEQTLRGATQPSDE